MPYLQLPDGRYMEVPDGVSAQEAMDSAVRNYPEAYGMKPPTPPAKSGLMSAFESGAQSGVGDVAQGIGTATGLAGLASWGQRQQANAAAGYKPTSDADIDAAEKANPGMFGGIGTRITQAAEPYAQGAGNIVGRYGIPTLAGAAATLAIPEEAGAATLAAAGTGTARILGAFGANTVAGATSAATFGAVNTATYIGDELNKQKARGESQDYGSAIAYGIAHGAIDQTVGGILHAPMAGVLGKTAAEQAAALAPKVLAGDLTAVEAQEMISGTLKNVAQGTAQNAAIGTGMMVGHEALNRSAAGQDLTSPEAMAAYGENVKGALAFAPIFGAMHGLGARGAAEKTLTGTEATRTGIQAQAAEAAATTPEALQAVIDNKNAATAQMQVLQQQAKDVRPGKGATDDEKQAYKDAQDAVADHRDNVLKPALAEYTKRQALIAPMETQQKLVAEQQVATATQAERMGQPLPTAAQQQIPGMEPEQPGPVQTQAAPTPDLGAQRVQLQSHVNDLQQRMLTSADPAEITQLAQQHANATQALSTLPPDPVVARNEAIAAGQAAVNKAQAALVKAQKAKNVEKIPELAQAVLDAKAKVPAPETAPAEQATPQSAFDFSEPKAATPETPTKPIPSEAQNTIPGMEPEQPGPTLAGAETPVATTPDVERLRSNLTDQVADLEGRLSDSAKITPAESISLVDQLNSAKKALNALPEAAPTPEQTHAAAMADYNAAQKKLADTHKKWMKATDEGDWPTVKKQATEHARLTAEMPELPVMPEAPAPEKTAQLPVSETADKNFNARDARRKAAAEAQRVAEFPNSKQIDLFTGEHSKAGVDQQAKEESAKVGAPTSVPEQLAHLQNKMFLNIDALTKKRLSQKDRAALVAENYAIKAEYAKLSENGTVKPDPIQHTLFSLENLVRTAEDNGNTKEVERLSGIYNELLKKQDARRVANLRKTVHTEAERGANRDDPDLDALRKGAHRSEDKQQKFDGLGEEGYNRHVTDAAIERLKSQVTEPRRDGERALFDQANDAFKELGELHAKREAGGMTAQEAARLNKTIEAKTLTYNRLINDKILPVREKIEKLQSGEMTVRELRETKAEKEAAVVDSNPGNMSPWDHLDAQKAALQAQRETTQSRSAAQKKTAHNQAQTNNEKLVERPEIRAAADAGDTKGMVKALRESASPSIRWIGRMAAKSKVIDSLKIDNSPEGWADFMKRDAEKNGTHETNSAGAYESDSHTIFLNPKYAGSEWVAGHEMVHAITLEAINNPTPEQFIHVQRLKELYSFVKDNKALEGEYGIKDVHEFLSEGLSNKDFQDKLKGLSFYREGTVWGKFARLIAHIMGWHGDAQDNALMHLVNAFEAIHDTESQPNSPGISMFAKVNPKLTNAMSLANDTVGKSKQTLMERLGGSAKALTFEVHMIDQFAAAREALKGAAEQLPAYRASQQMYYLSATRQLNNFLGAVLKHGALERIEQQVGDHKEYIYRAKQGANLNDINQITLAKAHKLTGSADATNKLFSLYTIAKRAASVGLEKMNYDPSITQERLNQAMHEIESVPGLKEIFADAQAQYHEFNKGMIAFAVQSGAIKKEIAAKMLANKDYIPYYRENGDGSVSLFMGKEEITKIGNVKDQPALHELVGGNQRILDFNEAATQNAQMLLNMGLRNTAMKDLAYNLQDIGTGVIGKGAAGRSNNIFNFKEDGVDKHVYVSDMPGVPASLIIKGLEGIPIQQSALLKIAGMPSSLLRQIIVANPITAARILYKDTISSAIVSGSNLDVFGQAMTNAKAGLLERSGIVGGELFQGLPADMAHLLREAQSGKTGWQTALSKAHMLHAKADALTRQMRFDSYRKQGMSEMESLSMALESMNFTRRGISPSIHILNTLNPFINSQIQGLNVLIKSMRGNMPYNEKLGIQQKVFQRGMMIAAGSMLYASIMQDDDAYKNAAPDQKYNNWFMPIPGSNEKFRVPIPFEAGILFKAMPEAMVNLMYGHSEDAASGMRQAIQKLIPGGDTLGIPQIARPLIEAKTGQSFYTGRSIESIHEQQLPAGMRVRPTTTAFADELGGALNLSPVMIDHILNGYTGSLGTAVMGVASAMVFGKQQVEGTAALHGSQMPVIGSAFQPEDAGNVMNAAYEQMNQIKEIKNGYTELVGQGKTAEAAAYRERMANELAMSGVATKFTSGMTKFAKQIQQAKAFPQGTPEQQMQRIDELKKQRTNFAAQQAAQVAGKI